MVGTNVQRLRRERHWSQKELAHRLQLHGGRWSRAAVGMLESKGVRGERLSDVVTLCAALEVPLTELLDGDDEVGLRDGNEKPASWVREALKGELPRPKERYIVINRVAGIGQDDPEEVRRMARAMDLPVETLREIIKEISGRPSPTTFRDFLADLDESESKRTAGAKRGHASRAIKNLVKIYVATGVSGFPPQRKDEFLNWSPLVGIYPDEQGAKDLRDGDD